MKLYTIYFNLTDHETETELFASDTGTLEDGKKYLENCLSLKPGEYHADYVSELTTVHASNGDPYKVSI